MFKSGNVTIMVSDMRQAVGFYTETLGLRLVYEFRGALGPDRSAGPYHWIAFGRDREIST